LLLIITSRPFLPQLDFRRRQLVLDHPDLDHLKGIETAPKFCRSIPQRVLGHLDRVRHGSPKPAGVQRGQLTELASTDFASWAKESFEIATKIAYRNGGLIGGPRAGNKDCTTVAAAPVLPAGYVVSASWIADRRMIVAGYRSADLLTRITQKL
jgi:hypothetical protein